MTFTVEASRWVVGGRRYLDALEPPGVDLEDLASDVDGT